MGKHDGHRQRLYNRFLQEGLAGFTDHEVLEMLLFYSIPRMNTNEIAHDLLDEFGSFSQVLEASPEELQKVKGVGNSSATLISFAAAFSKYYFSDRHERKDVVLNTIEACRNVLLPKFKGARNELVYLLCLDAKCKMLACKCISEGSINSAGVSIRKIVEVVMQTNASAVVLAHNHPSGLAFPSGEDVQTTKRVARALHDVDVVLVDHLVISEDEYISMVQSKVYSPDDVLVD